MRNLLFALLVLCCGASIADAQFVSYRYVYRGAFLPPIVMPVEVQPAATIQLDGGVPVQRLKLQTPPAIVEQNPAVIVQEAPPVVIAPAPVFVRPGFVPVRALAPAVPFRPAFGPRVSFGVGIRFR